MDNEDAPPEVVVDALGVPVGIPVTGPDAERLRRQWSRSLSDRSPVVVIELDRLHGDGDVATDYATTALVTVAALDATKGQRINIHGGAVADEDGRTLAVIGPSGSGKTTAVALLATRLGYLSDETVSLDEALVVHAHPKPLSVITDPTNPQVKLSVSPDDAGLLRPPPVSRLHRIVLLHRGEDDSGLVPVAPAYAIAEIVQQTSSLVEVEQPILRLAETIDACGGVWSLRYREIGERLDELVGLLDREPRPAPARAHHPWRGTRGLPTPGAWRREPWLDAVEYDDEVVVMVDTEVRVLVGLGLVLWLALTGPRTLDELVVTTTEQMGDHPDAEGLVAGALALLAEDGLVIGPPA
ncbi:hypothetical protein L2K70_01455 [Nocardioides KLBMP 9356]|uniref:PqqD family peptide modification chaperone n=1 Tax=Nocardioides potassii TaxID=2911371 RepID=A0ABS9H817_9ACTN|nr:hypothetical protein [Nocardioides potassii]MCF6376263.1 hypothetical protein [Nocardioides potassii]